MIDHLGNEGGPVKPVHAVITTIALIVIGSLLALGTSFLLGISFPGLSRDLRVPLGYIALAVPLIVTFGADAALFGFRRERLGIAITSGLVLALMTLLGFSKWNVLAAGLSADQITALLALTVVAFVEEGIFRGVLQTQLITLLGKWRGLFAGVVFFSLWHIPQRLLAGLGGVDLAASLVPVLLVGTVLGSFMLAVRNTAGPAVLHTAVNWVERI